MSTKENFINRNILSTRNKIAHGENIPVPLVQFIEVKNFILDYIDTLTEYIMDVATNKSYLIAREET